MLTDHSAKSIINYYTAQYLNAGKTQDEVNVLVSDILTDTLYTVKNLPIHFKKAKTTQFSTYIPGRFIDGSCIGPDEKCEVMVITPRPDFEDSINQVLISGSSAELLDEIIINHNIDINNWYITSLCKYNLPIRDKRIKLESQNFRECADLLKREIEICKPDFIIAMGSEVIKVLLGNHMNLTKAQGAVLDYNNIPVACCNSPNIVAVKPEAKADFEHAFVSAYKAFKGEKQHEVKFEYLEINNINELEALKLMLKAQNINTFAIDCEWGGDHAYSANGKLRTVQFAWSPTSAAVVVLRKEDCVDNFDPSPEVALNSLKELLTDQNAFLVGQHLRADLIWLYKAGFDFSKILLNNNIFDTMLASHVFDESGDHGLEYLANRFLGMHRYDLPLEKAKEELKLSSEDGYSKIPCDILHPYAAADVIATFRLWNYYSDLLNKPENKGLKNVYETVILRATAPILEIECSGIELDQDRAKYLIELFHNKREELLDSFRTKINWSDFNYRSPDQVKEFLFTTWRTDGSEKKTAPPGAVLLGLTPYKDTSKPPNMWADIIRNKKQDFYNPSTDIESLIYLSEENDLARELSKIKLIDQVCKNFLRAPDENGVFDKGLLGLVHPDGRLRTSITQLLETGRWGSRRPNLQNIPKKQEAEMLQKVVSDSGEISYTGLFANEADKYYPIRSCFNASDGKAIIEADYQQAELWTMAYLSGDEAMIAALNSGLDMHSITAINMFAMKADWEAYKAKTPAADPKKFLKIMGKSHLRVAAKTITFGVAYGRGPKAVAREIEKAGVTCSYEQAKAFIDSFFSAYPKLKAWITNIKAQVEDKWFVENPFGRRRHFAKTQNESLIAAYHREAVNFPIQGTVADAVSSAVFELYKYRYENPEYSYTILLAIHDAILLEVPIEQVDAVKNIVFPECMINKIVIPGYDLKYSIDVEVTDRWGAPPSAKLLEKLK